MLTFAILLATGYLLFQGWRYVDAHLHQRVLTQERTALLHSIERRQHDFMRRYNRYAGSLDRLRLTLAESSSARARVVTFNTKDGPAFFAEVCNEGGCNSVDSRGTVHRGLPVKFSELKVIVPPDLEPAEEADAEL